MARPSDTIAALATPAGISALALIRISGPDTNHLAASLGLVPSPRMATHCDFRSLDGALVDDVVATLYAAPHSYTGEDALELSCHGSPYIVRRILEDLFARGCRPAGPGEFTQRAFLNGRMDLSQAEAVMDLINARSDRALAAAQAVLRGALGRHMAVLVDGTLGALANVEAYIDFPDEDLPTEDLARLVLQVKGVLKGTDQLLATERTGAQLRDGILTVIIGEANAGKSSLFNRIVGSDRAIVSPEPGTTRDYIEVLVGAGSHALRLVDTAGMNPTATGIEALGVARSLEKSADADIIILVLEAGRPTPALPAVVLSRIKPSNTIVALNKSDLLPVSAKPMASPPSGLAPILVSAKTGDGVRELLQEVTKLADGMQETVGEERIAINVRHAHFLTVARSCLVAALEKLEGAAPAELLASDLQGALAAFGEISGKVDNERMLDQLFASFCIGK